MRVDAPPSWSEAEPQAAAPARAPGCDAPRAFHHCPAGTDGGPPSAPLQSGRGGNAWRRRGRRSPGAHRPEPDSPARLRHIRRAVFLSVAYMSGSPRRAITDEYGKVRAENDWTTAQAAEYPDRLIAFCGFNPLKDYALEELVRCARTRRLNRGIKLHLGNSDVQLENPDHVARLRQVFRAANQHRMAIVLHMRASISRQRPYGPTQARAFLEQLLPEAPDVPVQVAHLAATGPGYDDPPGDSVMAFLAEAVHRKDPWTRNL